MKWVLFVMIFVLAGAFFIISNNNLHLGNTGEFNQFMDSYYGWFFKLAHNAGTMTGYIVNINWMP
jgi:hypothetical protein